MPARSSKNVPAPLVALASWLVPGAGYLLLGQKARGLTIGVTVILLFVAGLLIGGIRVLEVPGYGDHGQPLIVIQDSDYTRDSGRYVVAERMVEDVGSPAAGTIGWVMQVHPLDEIRNKPWFIAQVLAGPIDLAASWGSVVASRSVGGSTQPRGARSHARTNELGVLYTAVAGMLNLLAIIDAGSRAGREEDDQ
jgi:hypothetical protein